VQTWYFDLDGTLLDFSVPFEIIYERALARLGLEPRGFETFDERFGEVFGNVAEPYTQAIAAIDLAVEPAAFSETLIETEIDHAVAAPGAGAILESLSSAGHQVGILTNGLGRVQRGKLETVGLADRVDAVVVSSEVGAWKPDADIYRLAEERLAADEYTFVADDLERDLVPALECGWRGVYVGPDAEGLEASGPGGDLEARLSQVETLEAITSLDQW